MSDEALPSGWVETTLGEAFSWRSGGTPSRAIPDYFDGQIPWAVIGDLTDGPVTKTTSYISEEGLMNSAARWVKPGAVLLAMYGASIGRIGIAKVPLTTNQAIASTEPSEISSEYIFWYLSARKNDLVNLGQGAAQKNISLEIIRGFPFLLPPLTEQARIVEELEKLITRLDSAVASLKRIQANLRRYRTAVLKASCEGRLVPAEAELPEKAWNLHRIRDFCEIDIGFAFKSAEFSREGIRLLRGENIEPGRLRWEDVRHWSEGKLEDWEHLLINEGDIILAMDRPLISAGLKIARATKRDLPCLLVQRMARIRPADPEMTEFLYYTLQTDSFIRHLLEGQTGTQLPHISGKQIGSFALPLPPVEEQRKITSEISRRLSLVEGAEASVEANLLRACALRASILAQAFQGRLGPQDSNDEPASVLLERIRQARSSQSPGPHVRKERRKPSPVPHPALSPSVRAKEPPPAAEPEPEPEPPESDFLSLPRDEQVEIAWVNLFGRGEVEKDLAIRDVAEELRTMDYARFKRLRQDGPLYSAITAAIERGVREGSFDRPRRGYVRAVLRDPKDYASEDWRWCLLAVVDDTETVDVDTALRAAAEKAREAMGLEFARLREDGVILTGLREALGEMVRAGELVRKGGRVRRA